MRPLPVQELLAQGHASLRAGRPADAVRRLAAASVHAPDHPGVHHLLGIAHEHSGNAPAALAAYRRVLGLLPGQSDVALRAAGLLLRLGHRQPAADLLIACAAATTDPPARHLCRARALGMLDRHEAAAAELRALLALRPEHAEAWRLLGNALAAAGELAAAQHAFRQAVALAPDDAAAMLDLVRAGRVSEADRPLLRRLQATLLRTDTPPRRQVLAGFALGKAHDDLGEPEAAIRAFDHANAIRAREARFDPDALATDVDRIMAAFPRHAPAAHWDGGRAVIIVGMPRAGTTLVEQILSAHRTVADGGEMGFWGEHGRHFLAGTGGGVAALAAAHAQALTRVSASAGRVTDKNPFNFAWLGLIRQALPEAAIIHCRRDPRDTCLSAYMTLFTGGNEWAASRSGLAAFYRQYQRLMAHWRAILPPDRFLEVDYEAIVADPAAAARQLVSFCGLPWDEACLRPEANTRAVHTASLYQARQPIHRRSVGRWRLYEPWLGELASLAA